MSLFTCTASVNGGEPVLARLVIEHEQVDITTMTEPDPNWQYTDPAGHYHARSAVDPPFPTLKRHDEHVDCTQAEYPDHEDCDGYTLTTYRCNVCDADVTPGYRATMGQRFMRGRMTWHAEVDQAVEGSEWVSVVVDTPHGGKRFGFAVPADFTAEGGSDGITVRTRLLGASPLGEWRAPGGVL